MNQEVKTINGYGIKDEKAVRTYDTVALMKADRKLKEGQHVKTRGYYSINDGGSAEYYITDTQSQSDYQENLENGLYANLIHTNEIILNQLGTKDETNFDCSPMFRKAFSISGVTRIKLLIGRYRVSSKITVPPGFTIEGTENQFNYSEITLISSDSCVIEVEQRNITLDNLLINKNGEFTCYGINGETYNNNHYNLTVKRCRLVGFTTAIRLNGSLWWESSIEDTRVSLSEIGIHIVNSFDLILKQFYTDRCDRSIALYGINTITFYNCNIGVINEGIKVLFGADGQTNNLTFIGCNFEYDEELESADGGFIDVATNRNSDCYITMINNRFTINGQNENVKSLAFNRHTTISFLNNFYYPNSEIDNPTSFFNTLRPPKLEIGCLKFLGGNESLPRPDYSGANKPAVLDLENGGIPKCNTGVADLQYYTNTSNGQLVYGDSSNTMYVYTNNSWKKLVFADL